MTDDRDDPESRLARIERLLEDSGRDVGARVAAGHARGDAVAVSAVILVAVAVQLMLPHRLAFQPYWLLPTLELVLMVGLFIANPRRIEPGTRWLRWPSLALTGVITLANGWAAVRLVAGLVRGTEGMDAGRCCSPVAVSG